MRNSHAEYALIHRDRFRQKCTGCRSKRRPDKVLGLRRSALPVDGASVRKWKKAGLTVVSAHTGRTNSAKRKAMDRIMRNAVIDGDTTGCCSVENKAFFGEV